MGHLQFTRYPVSPKTRIGNLRSRLERATSRRVLADNGGAFFVSGAPDPRWNDANIDTMKRLHGTDFEVVTMTGLIVP